MYMPAVTGHQRNFKATAPGNHDEEPGESGPENKPLGGTRRRSVV